MLFNLAIKNIKKSFKEYSIYFFTLVIGVAIFYTFNSLDAQEAMITMSSSKKDIIESLVYMLSYISVFISVILGFLIVYSNSYLVKRRKKEFGLYLTLGMSRYKVSMILVLETLIVGLISLGTGLLLGIILSQGLSILTVKLFEVDMSYYRFAFSSASLIKTIIYFSIIFIFVMIFNVILLSKKKIINLLTDARKNEKVRFRNKYVILIAFVLSIIFIGYAYNLLFNGAMFSFDKKIVYMLLSGSIGTFLLFFSISGFFLRLIQKKKSIYYNNLNMFVLKQIDSKANKAVISTTIISLMLLLTIGILSGAISLVSVFNNDFNNNNRMDITITNCRKNIDEENGTSISYMNELTTEDFFKDYIKSYAIYHLYYNNIKISNLVDKETYNEIKKAYGEEDMNFSVDIMSLSDYNAILRLYGMKEITLEDDRYLLTSDMDKIVEYYQKLYKNGNELTINNYKLSPSTKDITYIGFQNSTSSSNSGTIIVPDSVVKGLNSHNTMMIANYISSNDIAKLENDFARECYHIEDIRFNYNSRIEMQTANLGMKVILTFVGLYLGIIFAISSATILAIKELSESNDNRDRYLVLKQIGADEKMTKKALFIQIGIAFLFPLIVALFHSYFGLRELNGVIELLGHINLTTNIILTSLFIVIIYGGYFLATYEISKKIIK